jgi:tRNA pseudouridine55 synthase
MNLICMNGLLNIDKPSGLTSHDVVGRVRHILHERRVGHTGTLDPFATGVLLVLVGRATRLAQFLSGTDKEYDAIIRLGYSTETGDITGAPLSKPQATTGWAENQIETAMASLRGEIEQTPPMYSAKKIAGRKLYELARRGEEVERKPIRVCIHQFASIRPDGELIKDNRDGTFDFHVRVRCSSGTYVRTLAEDFGKRLGVGAHLAELKRTTVGNFQLTDAITLDQLRTQFAEEGLGTILVPPEVALSHMPFVHLSDSDARKVQHGMEVETEGEWADGTTVRMCDESGELIAVGNYRTDVRRLQPRVVITPAE